MNAYTASLAWGGANGRPSATLAQPVTNPATIAYNLSMTVFHMLYSGIHDLLSLGLNFALIAQRHWALPIPIAAPVFFVLYQLHDYCTAKDVMKLPLPAIDPPMPGLIAPEWQVQYTGWAQTEKGRYIR